MNTKYQYVRMECTMSLGLNAIYAPLQHCRVACICPTLALADIWRRSKNVNCLASPQVKHRVTHLSEVY